MNPDVFSAALRATAKVAFSMALVAGCTASERAEAVGASDSDIEKGCPDHASKADAAPGAAPDAAPDATPDCNALLASYDSEHATFRAAVSAHYADGGAAKDAPKAPPVSVETTSCCRGEVSAKGWKSPYRESCCSGALASEDGWQPDPDPAIAMACTPWGPPVPPAMRLPRDTDRVLA